MYFTLTQFQYLGLAIFMGLLVFAVLGIAVWSYRLNLKARREDDTEESMVPEEKGEVEFADGLQEGHNGIPLVLILLIAFMIVWGVGYTLAHAFGVFYAQ